MDKEKGVTRILLVLSKPPVPEIDGGCVAIAASVRMWVKSGFQLNVVCFHTPKHPITSETHDFFAQLGIPLETVFIDTRPGLRHLWYAWKRKLPFRAARFYVPSVGKRLRELCKENAITGIVWEGLYAAVYEPEVSGLVLQGLRSHNVEHAIWQNNPVRSVRDLIIRLDNDRLRRWEVRIWSVMHKIWAISLEDCNAISDSVPNVKVEFLPIPFEVNATPHQFSTNGISLYHLGAMDWLPNRKGMEEFLKQVWPEIHCELPEAILHLGGKAFPGEWENGSMPGVVFHGQVHQAVSEWISDKDLLVVPIALAGGVRVKILEAAAAGIPIMATSEALSGLTPELKRFCIEIERKEQWLPALHKWINYREKWDAYSLELKRTVSASYAYEKQINKLSFEVGQ